MSESALRVVLLGSSVPDWAGGGLEVELASALLAPRASDAVVFDATDRASLASLLRRADLSRLAAETAVVVIAPSASIADRLALLRSGVQDIVDVLQPAAMRRAVVHSVERKRLELGSRPAYATDPATGLPHEAQLLEHTSQLIALREREPAAMVLIVLRIEGFSSAAGRLGDDAAGALRRKVAVRLRSGLRASDVVAAVRPDAFAVLLGHVESASDGDAVAAKLVHALRQPFQVIGRSCAVAVAVGLARYPEHGSDATALLQRALSQASSTSAIGREGFASYAERGPARAANDESGAT